MKRTPRGSGLRKVELVDAALHVIGTRGIAALTTRSLAEEVGLTSGALFRHFASLDALLVAVVERAEEVLDSTYGDAGLPPAERLERFVEARSAAVGGQLGILRLVVSEQFLLALPRRGSSRLAAAVKKSRDFLLGCLREGQAERVFRADLSAEALVPVVMGTVQVLALSPARGAQRDAESRAVRGALLTLLRAPGAVLSKTGKRSA